MKKFKNVLILVIFCLLMVLAYSVPTIVADVEDKNLQERQEAFTLKNINLTSGDVNLYRELVDFQDLMLGDILTQDLNPEENENYEMIKAHIEEFLKLLTFGNGEMEKYSVAFFIISDDDTNSKHPFHPVWKWNIKDDSGNEYIFWLDELTGKVMSFQMKPRHLNNTNYKVIQERNSKLMKYYGFSNYETREENGQSYIRFTKEDTVFSMVELPYQYTAKEFYFNVMPF